MTKVEKAENFIKEVVAIIKGDDAEAKGLKILRQADSAFKTQISSLTGDTVTLEDALDEAKEALRLARLNNGNLITDRNVYIKNILEKQNAIIEAQEALDEHVAKIEFLKQQHDLLGQ